MLVSFVYQYIDTIVIIMSKKLENLYWPKQPKVQESHNEKVEGKKFSQIQNNHLIQVFQPKFLNLFSSRIQINWFQVKMRALFARIKTAYSKTGNHQFSLIESLFSKNFIWWTDIFFCGHININYNCYWLLLIIIVINY